MELFITTMVTKPLILMQIHTLYMALLSVFRTASRTLTLNHIITNPNLSTCPERIFTTMVLDHLLVLILMVVVAQAEVAAIVGAEVVAGSEKASTRSPRLAP